MNAPPEARGGLNGALAAVLKGEMTSAGLTFKNLHERTAISERQLQRLLNDERDIDVNVLATIAAVFRLTPTEAMARANEWQRRYSPERAGEEIGQAIRKQRARTTKRNEG